MFEEAIPEPSNHRYVIPVLATRDEIFEVTVLRSLGLAKLVEYEDGYGDLRIHWVPFWRLTSL